MINRIKRRLNFMLLIAGVLISVLFFDYLGLFAGIDNYFYDTFLRVRGERTVNERIVIAAIDAKALEKFGRWPIDRRHYADMLDRLNQAAVVAFDLLLQEPSRDDGLLAAAIKKNGKVLLPEYVNSGQDVAGSLQRFSPCGSGHIHIELGIDNTARDVFHSIYCHDMLVPSLTSVIYEMVTGERFFRSGLPAGSGADSNRKVFQMEPHKINFYGTPGRFRQISLADIVDGTVPASYFKDRIVLVGLTAPGIVDEISTPLSQSRNRMSGVEVHAGILNNLLDKSSIHTVPDILRIAALTLASFVLCICFLKMNEKKASLLFFCSLVAVIFCSAAFLFAVEYWLQPTVYLVSFCAVFAFTYLYRLDSAARKLDRERDVMTALLGWDAEELKVGQGRNGLLSILTEGGLNVKIQRQIGMTTRLLGLHKQLEAALKIEREALDNQVRFVEMLSHEYRTPLAIIRANLDILEMKENRQGEIMASGNFVKMKRAMSRLVEIMDNSLRRDRLDETGLLTSRQEIELVSFVIRLVYECGELWSDRRLEFGLKGESCIVMGDGSLLKTALLNLIDNAIKYSAETETVRILLDISSAEALFAVSNRGPVISEADHEKIFDKFYRGRGSSNTQGAGLGLYLVRRIVEQHNGRITITSDQADGTVASIVLPLV